MSARSSSSRRSAGSQWSHSKPAASLPRHAGKCPPIASSGLDASSRKLKPSCSMALCHSAIEASRRSDMTKISIDMTGSHHTTIVRTKEEHKAQPFVNRKGCGDHGQTRKECDVYPAFPCKVPHL